MGRTGVFWGDFLRKIHSNNTKHKEGEVLIWKKKKDTDHPLLTLFCVDSERYVCCLSCVLCDLDILVLLVGERRDRGGRTCVGNKKHVGLGCLYNSLLALLPFPAN